MKVYDLIENLHETYKKYGVYSNVGTSPYFLTAEHYQDKKETTSSSLVTLEYILYSDAYLVDGTPNIDLTLKKITVDVATDEIVDKD